MSVSCIPHTRIPGSSRLFLDYLYQFDRVAEFYRHPPSLERARDAAGEIKLAPERRRALVEALTAQNDGCCAATTRLLETLGEPDTVVVATGQQVGLFGGPALAIYKALTAIKIAERLSNDGLSAVPVFWLAAEDHDLDEVDHSWTPGPGGEPIRIKAHSDAGPNQPVGSARFRDCGVEALREAIAGQPYATEVEQLVRRHYREGASFTEAIRGLFCEVFGERGLIFLDPTRREIRELSAPIVRRALENAPELTAELRERSAQLEQSGYHSQVLVEDTTSLVFLVDEGRRIALKRNDETYSAGKRRFSTDDLLNRLERDSEAFSPNALLRPVIQDAILPTAVYVGGPAELAYQAQSSVLYERLLGRIPLLMPRAFFTLVDPAAAKLLDRAGLSVPDCFQPSADLEAVIAARLTPPSLKEAFDAQGARVDAALSELGRELEAFDGSLNQAFGRSRKKIAYQLEKMRGKAARESLRRDERAAAEARRLGRWLYPNRGPQERTFCYPALAARLGLDLTDKIYDAIAPDCPDHQVLRV